jgi:ArsR family transcriptional regulator
MLNPALAQEISQLEADFCFALSDPTRILMLYALSEGPRNVTEIAHELGITQPNASRHLKVLRERGLAQSTRQGTNITYHLSDERVIQALDLLRACMRDGLARRATLIRTVGSGGPA